MKLDLALIEKKVEDGMLYRQSHPSLPLHIYKYSIQCVFMGAWDEITMLCRGLVLDTEGNVVVNSMPKFFNHNQPQAQAILQKMVPGSERFVYTISNKMDGSLIQVANWKGNRIVTSSGSFGSVQAIKATELLDTKYPHCKIEDGKTYIFELIYPENRIVVNYGDLVSLTLLAVRDTDTGEELPLDPSFDCVETLDKTIEEILVELPRADYINKEGYIAKFANGDRIKFKYDEYCRLHKVVSGVNEKYVWECLKNGTEIEDVLTNIPDELFDFVKRVKADLKTQFSAIEQRALLDYTEVRFLPSRKEQAQWLFGNKKDLAAIVFCMLDGKSYSDKIWDMVKPTHITKFGMGDE